MIISILASTSTGGIGNKGTLPWPKHRQDMTWFKEHTTNQIVVMGRNTWDDPKMTKPLPGRENYVVSSKHVAQQYQHLVKWIPSNPVENILQLQKDNPKKDVYIIGGKQLYEATAHIVNRVYLSRMKENWFSDTRINLELMLACFQIKSVTFRETATFETWDRTMFFNKVD